MADRRKLQGEIERCLKKVNEGVETFDDIWRKVHSATNANQKEKYEADLKKEIKKLQRLRDQIKTWLSSSDIKDKRQLQDTRRLIETQMERFKVVERETKTKAYSKEGLSGINALAPAEKEKTELDAWLSESIYQLNIQVDRFESEIEVFSTKKCRSTAAKDALRVEELQSQLSKHRFHINKLETLLRMLDNGTIEMDKIQSVRDDVNYYIESCLNSDFEENEYVYDDLNLDESCAPVGVVEVKSASQSNVPSEHGSDSPHNELSTPPTPLSTTTQPPVGHSPSFSLPSTSTTNNFNNHHSKSGSDSSSQSPRGTPNNLDSPSPVISSTQLSESKSTNRNVLSSSMQMPSVLKPVPMRPPSLPAKSPQSSSSPSPALGVSTNEPSKIAYSSVVATPAPTTNQPAAQQVHSVLEAEEAEMLSGTTANRMNGGGMHSPSPVNREQITSNGPQTGTAVSGGSPTKNAEVHMMSNNPAMEEGSPVAMLNALNQQSNPDAPPMTPQSQSSTPITNGVCEMDSPQQQKLHSAIHQQVQASEESLIQQQQQQLQQQHQQQPSYDVHIPPLLGVAPLGKSTMSKECYYQLHHLNWASQHLPHPSDSERGRNYLLRQPCATPSYYPPGLPHNDPLEIFQRLTPDTLFFIFYYMEGTRAQYLSAKALKKQSWRFHTKYMMWFQRHEEPRTITDEFERGTYIYFDYERWSQRRKEGFTFEYRYLEDRELN